MVDTCGPTGFVKLFPTEDIPRIIQNLLTCCTTLIRKDPFELENDLTKRLFLQLCRCPEYRIGPIEPHWESQVVVVDESEAEVTGRVDMKFSCGRGIETYFPVEAKRLYVTYPKGKKASLVKDYINDGMMRFVTGQYGSQMITGAMLGFVCDSTVPAAKFALEKAIALDAEILRISPSGEWHESPIPVSPPVCETGHELPEERIFTIYHVLTKV